MVKILGSKPVLHKSIRGLSQTIYFNLAVLMVSLQSFYFAGSAWFCLVGYVMFLPFVRWKVPRANWTLAFALIAGTLSSMLFAGLPPASGIGQAFSITALLVVPAVFKYRTEALIASLRFAVFVHSAFIFSQFAIFLFAGVYFDPLDYLGMMHQVVLSRKGISLGGIIVPRFSGLFNEPGTYSTILCALVGATFALTRRIDKLMLFSVASTFLSVSLGGMITATVLIFAMFVLVRSETDLQRILKASTGAIALCGVVYWVTVNVTKRVEITEGDVLASRFLDWVLHEMPFTLWGLDWADLPTFYTFGYLGSLLDIYLVNGLFGATVTAAFSLSGGMFGALLSTPLFLSKIKLVYPLLYFLLAAIRLGSSSRA